MPPPASSSHQRCRTASTTNLLSFVTSCNTTRKVPRQLLNTSTYPRITPGLRIVTTHVMAHAPSLDDACDGSPCFAPPDLEAGSDLKYSCDEHQIGNSPLTFPAPFLRHGNTRQCAFVRARHSELSRLECVGRDHAPLCTSHDRVWVPFRGS